MVLAVVPDYDQVRALIVLFIDSSCRISGGSGSSCSSSPISDLSISSIRNMSIRISIISSISVLSVVSIRISSTRISSISSSIVAMSSSQLLLFIDTMTSSNCNDYFSDDVF